MLLSSFVHQCGGNAYCKQINCSRVAQKNDVDMFFLCVITDILFFWNIYFKRDKI